jgi:carbon monoxide dehydrogenase subunit G
MQLGSSFRVPADPDTVFARFLDAPTMQSCIPGCEELVRTDDTHFTGRLVNQIAHVKFNAAFSAEITELDPPRQVVALLKGEDMRLGSSLKLNATLTVQPDGDGSQVSYAMDMALWGKLGRLGESIFRRRTAEVEKQFVAAFSQACTTGLPAAAPDVARHAAPDAASDRVPSALSSVSTGTTPAPAPRPAPVAAPAPVPAPAPAVAAPGRTALAPTSAPTGWWQRLAARLRRVFSRGAH